MATKQITLSDGERLILAMLGDIHRHLQVKGHIDAEFVRNALHGGHEWGLMSEYHGILQTKQDDPAVVDETIKIMMMWTVIEECYERLPPAEKKRVEKRAAPHGKDPRFRGFQMAHEPHYLVARFVTHDLDRFPHYKDRLLSEGSQRDEYRRMLAVWGPLDETLTGDGIDADDIAALLAAQRNPYK